MATSSLSSFSDHHFLLHQTIPPSSMESFFPLTTSSPSSSSPPSNPNNLIHLHHPHDHHYLPQLFLPITPISPQIPQVLNFDHDQNNNNDLKVDIIANNNFLHAHINPSSEIPPNNNIIIPSSSYEEDNKNSNNNCNGGNTWSVLDLSDIPINQENQIPKSDYYHHHEYSPHFINAEKFINPSSSILMQHYIDHTTTSVESIVPKICSESFEDYIFSKNINISIPYSSSSVASSQDQYHHHQHHDPLARIQYGFHPQDHQAFSANQMEYIDAILLSTLPTSATSPNVVPSSWEP